MDGANLWCETQDCGNPAIVFGMKANHRIRSCDVHLAQLLAKKMKIFDITGYGFITTLQDAVIFEERETLAQKGRGYLAVLEATCERELCAAIEAVDDAKLKALEVMESRFEEMKVAVTMACSETKYQISQLKTSLDQFLYSKDHQLSASELLVCSDLSVSPSFLSFEIAEVADNISAVLSHSWKLTNVDLHSILKDIGQKAGFFTGTSGRLQTPDGAEAKFAAKILEVIKTTVGSHDETTHQHSSPCIPKDAPPEAMRIQIDMSPYHSLPTILQAEIHSLLSENPLYLSFLQSPSPTPMSLDSLAATAEALIDFSAQTYKDCISRRQRLPSMPQVCLSYFAGGKCADFVAGVLEHRQQSDVGALLSRLLALPGTIPLSYCGTLNFPRLCNWLKAVKAKGGKAAADLYLSGKISLAELLTAAYEFFASDPASGSRLVASLYTHCPIAEDTLSAFIISHRMSFFGLSNLALFKTIDQDGSGQLSCDEFTAGIRQHLSVWMEDSMLRKLFAATDTDRSNSIKRIEFNTIFNFKRFYDNANSELFAVEMTKAIMMLMEVIDAKTARDLSSFESVITGLVESKEEFARLLATLDPELDKDLVQQMYMIALSLSQPPSDTITREAAIRCLLRYPPVKSPLAESERLLGSR